MLKAVVMVVTGGRGGGGQAGVVPYSPPLSSLFFRFRSLGTSGSPLSDLFYPRPVFLVRRVVRGATNNWPLGLT